VIKKCNDHHIAECIADLLNKHSLKESDIVELETADKTLTKILVQADQCLQPLSSVLWSLAVQQAYLLHQFWVLTHMAKCTARNLSDARKCIQECLDPALINTDPNVSLSTKLHQAQKALKKVKCKADHLCQQHLEKLLNKAITVNHAK